MKVTVKRNNSARPLSFEIVRGEIPSVSVNASYIVDGNVGYVRVTKFAQNTYSEFLQALVQLKAKGAQKFILDLRGNTGGLLEQAILMANEFLPAGQRIVEVRGRKAVDNATWLSDGTIDGLITEYGLKTLCSAGRRHEASGFLSKGRSRAEGPRPCPLVKTES